MNRRAECACGRVSIEVEGDPVRVLACHCDYCQKRTGNVFQVSCWYPHDRVVKREGGTKVFNDSANTVGVNYEFCPNCGSTVHWTFDHMPQFRGIAVGCFVDKTFPQPEFDIQTQYRHHWIPPIEGTSSYPAFPPPDVMLKDL